jgi:subtilisin family serine protease
MKKLATILLLMAALTMSFSGAAPIAAETQKGDVQPSPNGVYIIQMMEDPVVAYEGGIPGLAATAPGRGEKINPNSAAVANYVKHLTDKHSEALGRAGGGQKLYDYTYSFNGFAAQLSLGQAKQMAAVDGVVAVTPDELQQMDTSSTPSFLELDADGGLWEQLGGVGNAGEGIIIGIVDSGIWPESLSFTDRVDKNGVPSEKGKLVYRQIPGWNGKCVPGEEFDAADCNQKLIGAQYFNAGWGGDEGIDLQKPWEFNSPRDYNGHGSHTSSTAGGNHGVPITGPAAVFGTISGMAPRARVAMYKALWSTEDGSQANGYGSDLVAAIDTAVADGVDVITYSISGSRTNFADPVMISYLFAARAGIFVSCSAGNNGPTASTVAHPGPWVTTVAASTHNRSGEGSVTMGNGATYYGASLATAVGPAPLIASKDAGVDGVDPATPELVLCYSSLDGGNLLDPAKVAGKIVVCDRGITARVNKSLAVQEAGGVGMILLNVVDASLNADFHSVPTVHLQVTDYAAVHAYADAPNDGATATINQATVTYDADAPLIASFSSAGPLLAGGGDVLKPDVTAPGVDILAAVAPPGNSGFDFNLYSGTSMSTPHVAGVAALLMNAHPDWSPMAIKSALMTSGYDLFHETNTTDPLVIFQQGAGHIAPNGAADPGLVFDAGWYDWLAFLCGTTTIVDPASCDALAGMGYSFDASDMNVASIAIGDLAGEQTVTRKVTNVSGATRTFRAAVHGMDGIDVVVSPADLTLQPGETQAFQVTFTRTTAPLNTYVGGQLTWKMGGYNVRIPMVVRPFVLGVPASVFGTGDPISYPVTFGYDGAFTAAGRGLVAATTYYANVLDDPTDGACNLNTPNAIKVSVNIPEGTTYARFSLFDDYTDGADDLDLCVYLGTTQVGSSGSGTSAEEINLLNPVAGDYTVVVQGWGTDGPDAWFTLFHWLVGSGLTDNMAVTAPTQAVIGETGTIELAFSGLAPATKYLGNVAYSGTNDMPNPTIVRVDTP